MFVRLSHYGREIVPTEAKRCKRSEEGLIDNIKIMITALGITNFTKLVEAALKVERVRVVNRIGKIGSVRGNLDHGSQVYRLIVRSLRVLVHKIRHRAREARLGYL